MKKKNLKSLNLNKKAISDFSNVSKTGGAEVSERRTNCDVCPGIAPAEPCFSHNDAASCGWICAIGSGWTYTYTWSS
jgi:hypothetical protein